MILDRDEISRLHRNMTLRYTAPVRPSHRERLEDGRIVQRAPWAVGRTYAVQRRPDGGGRLGPAVCRVEALEVSLEGDIWVASIRIVRIRQEPARLLAPSGGRERGHDEDDPIARGYTDRSDHALSDEPEAVDADVQDRFSKQGRQTHAQRKLLDDAEQLRGQQHTLEERMARIERLAQERGLDVSSDLRVVRAARDRCARRLDAIEQRIHDQRAA